MTEKPLLSVEDGKLRFEIFSDIGIPYPETPKGTIFYEPCDDIIISGAEGTSFHSLDEFAKAAKGYNIFRIQADKYSFFKYLDTNPLRDTSRIGTCNAAIAFAPSISQIGKRVYEISEEESLFLESVAKYYGGEYTYFVISQKCKCCDQYKSLESIFGCDGIEGALAAFRECLKGSTPRYKRLYDKAYKTYYGDSKK